MWQSPNMIPGRSNTKYQKRLLYTLLRKMRRSPILISQTILFYLCVYIQGHRFILGAQHLAAIIDSSNLDEDAPVLASILYNNIPLFLDASSALASKSSDQPSLNRLLRERTGVRDKDKIRQAQLMRIWISPPESPVTFVCDPCIEIQVIY